MVCCVHFLVHRLRQRASASVRLTHSGFNSVDIPSIDKQVGLSLSGPIWSNAFRRNNVHVVGATILTLLQYSKVLQFSHVQHAFLPSPVRSDFSRDEAPLLLIDLY